MNYAELIAEVATRVGDATFAARARQLVTQAETDLDYRFIIAEYPPLSPIATVGTNWLLRDNPEIYITAVLKQFYLFKLDVEQAANADTYMRALISAKKTAERIIRYRGQKPAIGGHTP